MLWSAHPGTADPRGASPLQGRATVVCFKMKIVNGEYLRKEDALNGFGECAKSPDH